MGGLGEGVKGGGECLLGGEAGRWMTKRGGRNGSALGMFEQGKCVVGLPLRTNKRNEGF